MPEKETSLNWKNRWYCTIIWPMQAILPTLEDSSMPCIADTSKDNVSSTQFGHSFISGRSN